MNTQNTHPTTLLGAPDFLHLYPDINITVLRFQEGEPAWLSHLEALADDVHRTVTHPPAGGQSKFDHDQALLSSLKAMFSTDPKEDWAHLDLLLIAAATVARIHRERPEALETVWIEVSRLFMESFHQFRVRHPKLGQSLWLVDNHLQSLAKSPFPADPVGLDHWEKMYLFILRSIGWREFWYSTGCGGGRKVFVLMGIPWEKHEWGQVGLERLQSPWGYQAVMDRVSKGELGLEGGFEEERGHGMGWMT